MEYIRIYPGECRHLSQAASSTRRDRSRRRAFFVRCEARQVEAFTGAHIVLEVTHRLMILEALHKGLISGGQPVKKLKKHLNIYEVLDARPLRTRLQVAARRGLTRFVGRQSELDQLRRALEQAKAGQEQIVGVMGELDIPRQPGLEKSREFIIPEREEKYDGPSHSRC